MAKFELNDKRWLINKIIEALYAYNDGFIVTIDEIGNWSVISNEQWNEVERLKVYCSMEVNIEGEIEGENYAMYDFIAYNVFHVENSLERYAETGHCSPQWKAIYMKESTGEKISIKINIGSENEQHDKNSR